jgi:hypothetical protein
MTGLATEVVTPGPGQCVLHNLGGRLFVERADPVIALSDALIRQIRGGDAHADLSLDGGVLVVDGANERVVYRLGPSGHAGYLLGRLC